MYFGLQRADAVTVNVVSKELQSCSTEVAFGGVDNNAVVAQTSKDLPYVVLMFLRACAGNQEVGVTKMQARQNLIDEPLESLCCIPESNGIRRNSNNPKGVTTAVFGTSIGSHEI